MVSRSKEVLNSKVCDSPNAIRLCTSLPVTV
jgi:hypothetical protein